LRCRNLNFDETLKLEFLEENSWDTCMDSPFFFIENFHNGDEVKVSQKLTLILRIKFYSGIMLGKVLG